jgi:hypothetical protein
VRVFSLYRDCTYIQWLLGVLLGAA